MASAKRKSVGIQIYARVKPTRKPFRGCVIEDTDSGPRLAISVPRDEASGYVNNKRDTYNFQFRHIFPPDSSQEDVFDVVAVPVVDSVLDGYNATIFAYGQTGSGKTFTITGGAERYNDRGIIPRVLTHLFEQFAKRSERVFEAKVSYLEIYNDVGYDLLDPNHEISKMEDLPKVELLDTGGGDVILRNLSQNVVATEEDALNALFIGDTNRMIAETPMNQASTRSHCIFTVHLTSRVQGAATMRRSKLHLVDLAGSERIGKTGASGNLATEAKYINLSLHYLEQVIVALSDKSRSHVPYRNSMMTSVLRDSLGGNCMTTMIATLSAHKSNLDESISTCRFAQRVAMIQNSATRNEETDPTVLVAKLKTEVSRLKAELALATGGEERPTDPLAPEELLQCKHLVAEFVESGDPDATITVGDIRKIDACFRALKDMVVAGSGGGGGGGGGGGRARSAPGGGGLAAAAAAAAGGRSAAADPAEVAELKELLRQRDNEISILVSRLKKQRGSRASGATAAPIPAGPGHAAAVADSPLPRASSESVGRPSIGGGAGPADQDRDRAALEEFKKTYHGAEALRANKHKLRQLYGDAKALGAGVNACRANINALKAEIERSRLEAGMTQLVDGAGVPELDDVGSVLRQDLEAEKSRYKSQLAELKDLKREIEHLQYLLERGKAVMLRDFEEWRAGGAASAADDERDDGGAAAADAPGGGCGGGDDGRREAWGSPPPATVGGAGDTGGSADAANGGGGPDDDIAAFFRAREALKRAS